MAQMLILWLFYLGFHTWLETEHSAEEDVANVHRLGHGLG